MKRFLCFLLGFWSCSAYSQCPVLESAMIHGCLNSGQGEGINEFIVFSTTAPATVASYTLYYGTSNPPKSSPGNNILAGTDAGPKTGPGIITPSSCITFVTTSTYIIPANSRVIFIPADLDQNYDFSSFCGSLPVYVVYINIVSGPGATSWNPNGTFANTPTNRYLQVVNGSNNCTSGIRAYSNGWSTNATGNSVSWNSTGVASYNNGGCTIIPPVVPPTATAQPISAVCAGTTTASLAYTATGSPNKYSITWNGLALTAGFINVPANTNLPASPISIAIPPGAPANTYSGTFTVTNSVTGTSSTPATITVTVNTAAVPTLTVTNNCGNSTLNVAGTTGTLTWSDGSTLPSPRTVTTGTFTVTQTVAGCTSAASNSVTANPSSASVPTLTVTNNCGNSTLNVAGTTGTLTWSDGSTLPSPRTVTTGTFTVTQTVAGCTSAASNSVTANPSSAAVPTLTVTNNCGNSTLNVTGTTGTLTWSDGSTLPSPRTVTTGTFTVTQTVAGCTSAASNSVTANPSSAAVPTLTVTNNCGNSTLNVTGTTGTLTWSDGSTLPSPRTVTTGTFTVTQTVAGCTSAASNSVTANPSSAAVPTLTVTNNCGNSTLNVTGTTGTLTWSDGSTLPSPRTVTTGTFTVTQTVAGCTSAASNSVTANPSSAAVPTLTVTNNCGNSTLNVTGTTGTLTWSDGSTLPSPRTVTTGTFTVTQTVAGCTSAASNSVTATPLPIPSIPMVTTTQPTCTTSGSITFTSPLDAGLLYSIDGTSFQSNPTFTSGVSAAIYTVTVKNSDGCTASSSTTINPVPSAPAAPLLTVTQATCTIPTGSINVTSVSGLTYSIDGVNFATITSFTTLIAKSYTITAKNANGCTASATATINAAPATPATPNITTTQPTCTTSGSITVTAPTGSGLTYSIDGTNFQTGTLFSSVNPANYTVTVKNSDGCTASSSTTINPVPSAPAAPLVTVTQATCTIPTGSIDVTPVSGLTYSIDGVNFATITSFTTLIANSYTITAKNANGCTATATATINAAPATPATPNITTTQPTCTTSGSITVTAPIGSGLTYSIDGTNFQTGTLFSSVNPATYTVTVKNSDGCTASLSTTINPVPSAPAAPLLTVTQATCTIPTGSIDVTSVSGLTYSIDGINFATTISFTGLAANSYTITAKNSSGCITTATATINAAASAPVAPAITVTQATCTVPTGKIDITPIAGITYSIDGINFSGTTSFTGLAPNTYTITAKNSSGCTAISSGTINTAPVAVAFPILTVTQPTCSVPTGKVDVTPPVAGLTYSIDGVNFTGSTSFTGLNPGTPYIITAKSISGCTATTPALINAISIPSTPTAAVIQPTCSTPTGTITITAQLNSTYSINGTTYQASNIFNNLSANTYTVYVKSLGGCTASASYTVNAVPAVPTTPVITVTQPGCNLVTGSITITPQNNSTYSIDGTTYVATNNFSNLPASNYTVYVKSSGGCIASTTTVLNQPPLIPAIPVVTVTQPSCTVNSGTITVTTQANSVYSLDGTNFQNNNIFNGLAANSYTVYVRNTGGCISKTITTVNAVPIVPSVPALSIIQPNCNTSTGTIAVAAQSNSTYSIDGVSYQSSNTFTNVQPNAYTVYVKSSGNCVVSTTTIINTAIASTPTIVTTTVTPTCNNINDGQATLNITGSNAPYTVAFNNNASTSNFYFNGLAAGKYTFKITDNIGCTFDSSVTVPPYVITTPTTVLNETNPSCFKPASGRLNYNISGSEFPYRVAINGNSSFGANTNLIAGTYLIDIYNRSNCLVASLTKDLLLLQDATCDTIYVPSGFTPNRDQVNDILKPIGGALVKDIAFRVYNRYGNLIFHSENIFSGWDGTINGIPQPSGSYVWFLEYTGRTGVHKTSKGITILIR